MFEANCPQCGALAVFRSPSLPIRVCDYCRSTLVRQGDHLEALGKVAQVPDDVSPLRIGSTGAVDGRRFELIGRVRMRWADGGWNEWLALYQDGGTGWLSESMGRFMILNPVRENGQLTDVVRRLNAGSDVIQGAEASIQRVRYTVTDVKTATFDGGEGELPFSTPLGTQIISVDLMASDGQCASIQKDRGEISTYTGRFVTLAELGAGSLRRFDGWPLPEYAA